MIIKKLLKGLLIGSFVIASPVSLAACLTAEVESNNTTATANVAGWQPSKTTTTIPVPAAVASVKSIYSVGEPIVAKWNAPSGSVSPGAWIGVYPATPAVRSPDLTPAEFEPVKAVTIAWKDGYSELTDIARQVVQAANLDVMVNDIGQEYAARKGLIAAGVPLNRVRFITAPHNKLWVRDYGAIGTINSAGSLSFLDVTYRRWSARPLDNYSKNYVAAYYAKPCIVGSWLQDGGNYMTDGKGVSFYTNRMHEWNSGVAPTVGDYYPMPAGMTPMTAAEVDAKIQAATSTSKSIVIPYPSHPFDDTGHIDMIAKIISPTKILLSQVDSSNANYPELEAANTVLSEATNAAGQPYEVIRIPAVYSTSDLEATYANSLMVNHKVLVPSFSGAYVAQDAAAKAVYEAALPNYSVAQIAAQNIIKESGAVHCITQTVPDVAAIQSGFGNPNAKWAPLPASGTSGNLTIGSMPPGSYKLVMFNDFGYDVKTVSSTFKVQ